MYSILIVDDEKIERNGIKMLLSQLEYNFEISEAVNGEIAYEMLMKNDYDILFTDIKMPFMDGIELINKVYEQKRRMKYVIFSGCNEFSYAKTAVKLGVSDYILKPVDPEEFSNTIAKIIGEIEESKANSMLKNKNIEYLNEHMLYLATMGASVEEIMSHNKNGISLDFLCKFKRMMLIDFNSDFFGRKGIDYKDHLLRVESRIGKYLNLSPQQSVLFFYDNNLPFLDIAKHIHDDIRLVYGEKCYVAYSSEIEGFDGISKGMEELDILMKNKFYNHISNVFYKGMHNAPTSIIQIDDDTILKQMKQDVKMKDIISLREHFELFCDKYKNKHDISQVYVKFIFSNLLKDFYENLTITDEKELNNEIEMLYMSTDFNTVIEIVQKNIDRLEVAFNQNPLMLHKEIEVIKKYIYEHFGEDLSVESLAKMVYMAPSYLSSVFKKETGQNLSRFIKNYRMERAKDMLENTMAKITDISTICGYPNLSYFCSSFRECFGVSPQKFRENG